MNTPQQRRTALGLSNIKPKSYRRTGILPVRQESRQYCASQLREWRKAGKVLAARYPDGTVYLAEDRNNPYQIVVAKI